MTIPQYKNICWFIAILTGIAYSDNSKKLLLNNPHRALIINIKNLMILFFI
jgi:hypothetical protein